MDETTGRAVSAERATALSKELHDSPLHSMHGARLVLQLATPILPPKEADLARRGVEDLLGAIDVVQSTMGGLDPDWPFVNAGFRIPHRCET